MAPIASVLPFSEKRTATGPVALRHVPLVWSPTPIPVTPAPRPRQEFTEVTGEEIREEQIRELITEAVSRLPPACERGGCML